MRTPDLNRELWVMSPAGYRFPNPQNVTALIQEAANASDRVSPSWDLPTHHTAVTRRLCPVPTNVASSKCGDRRQRAEVLGAEAEAGAERGHVHRAAPLPRHQELPAARALQGARHHHRDV